MTTAAQRQANRQNAQHSTGPRTDEGRIRAATVQRGVPCITTISGAAAAINAIDRIRERGLTVRALQDYVADGPART